MQTNVKEQKQLEKEIYELIVDDPEEDAILERQFPSSSKAYRPKIKKDNLDQIEESESLDTDRILKSQSVLKKP